ncbi:MAG: CPBP family intramembrane metalloprotease [Candidatus Thiothrix sulfatifontis]|nr:MAG: CPBP family intramembrane metalloprotease [Candidatus Thiothrix sulfatifontis]
MNTSYLSLARLGKNHWWRYVLGLLIIVIFWQLLGAIPLGIMVFVLLGDNDPSTNVDPTTLQFEGVSSLWFYLGINFTLLAMLLGVFVTVRFLHQRHFVSLITPLINIDWKLMFKGFAVFFSLIALATFLEALFQPTGYQMTFDATQFLIFLPIALVITPLQAAAEELLFRGYVMQWLGLFGRGAVMPVLVSSLLFMVAHLANPEVGADAYLIPLLYLSMGVFLAMITVKSNSLELAIGVHAANNLFTVLIMNYADSALPAPSLFTASDIEPMASLISLVVIAALFYWIMFVWQRHANIKI